MKKVTQKQAAINRELTKVYREIDENRDRMCAGCLRWDKALDHSHRISRARRKDLTCDPENIDLMCRDCHHKVEAYDLGNLANGDEIREYIEKNEPQLLILHALRKGA